MAYDPNKITYIGQTDFRNQKVKFGIKALDRTRHLYTIGKTGMGKSTLLENMAIQDIQNGEGLAFIDPHGGSAEKLLDYIPEHRIKDVIYVAPFDIEHPVSFNVMESVDPDKRHLVASGLMSTFKKIWVDAWSSRMEYILGYTLLALLEYPGATLLSVNKMLTNKDFRKKVVEILTDPSVKEFWVGEFSKFPEKYAAEATPAIQNKIGQFTSNTLIRNMIGQPTSSFDFREAMDSKKIIIFNLSKGRIGEQNTNLLGGLIITKLYLAAMSRADAGPKELADLPNFYLYVDEFQSFASESFADILSEARKYKLNLNIAHQYIQQMPENVQAAVFGNVGTMVVFRVGSSDAEIFEKEFSPTFVADDIVNLGKFQMYLRLMIDGVGSKPFSATTFMIPAPEGKNYREEAISYSRSVYSKGRDEVEDIIRKSLEADSPGKTDKPETSGFKVFGDNDPNRFIKRNDDRNREFQPRNNYNQENRNQNNQPRPQAEFKAFGKEQESNKTQDNANLNVPKKTEREFPKNQNDNPKRFQNNNFRDKKPNQNTEKPEEKIEVSSKLKGFLENLDNEEKIDVPEVEVSPLVKTEKVFEKKEENKSPVIEEKPKVSESANQAKFGKKESNPMHVDALKQALSKAMKDKPVISPPPPPPRKVEEKKEEKVVEEESFKVKDFVPDDSVKQNPKEENKNSKEAPEDLLKSIIGE